MKLGLRTLDLRRPQLVGILNLTPDSFSDGGELDTLDAVLARAEEMIAAGADILDLGGESTRPGARPLEAEEEIARVLPAFEALAARLDIPLSVDTRRAQVAQECLSAGATMVNDVSGFGDPKMGEVVASSGAAWVLMHMPHAVGEMGWSKATPTMPQSLSEGLAQVGRGLESSVNRAEKAGVARDQLAIDPGLGFGKTVAQNLAFLRSLDPIARLNLPIFMGPSRKSFLGSVTGAAVNDRLLGTAAAVTATVLAGAAFVRVHDVGPMRQVVDVARAIRDEHA